ncbi:MAG: hypothetical protein IPM72_04200 [Chitinophagaceae bacterium]|nr:hypothetical protein [Chitinophagaceae bacterium]
MVNLIPKVMVCGNGYLSFDISLANWGSGSNGIGNTLPYFEPDTSTYIAFLLRSTIMGMFSTFDTRRCDNQAPAPPTGFPNALHLTTEEFNGGWKARLLQENLLQAITKLEMLFYDSTSSYVQPCFYNPNTFQIVLHETSGLIDVHIEDRICQPSLPQKGLPHLAFKTGNVPGPLLPPAKLYPMDSPS